jgi:hypothetical protein
LASSSRRKPPYYQERFSDDEAGRDEPEHRPAVVDPTEAGGEDDDEKKKRVAKPTPGRPQRFAARVGIVFSATIKKATTTMQVFSGMVRSRSGCEKTQLARPTYGLAEG